MVLKEVRCVCSTHRCGNVTDARTGEPGVLVPVRVYRRHEAADKNEALQRVRKIQAQALQAHEDSIARALSTVEDLPLPSRPDTTEEPRYRLEGIRRTLFQIGKIKDELPRLGAIVDAIGPHPTDRVVLDHDLVNALGRFSRLHPILAKHSQSLTLIGRGAYRKVSAVFDLRWETDLLLKELAKKVELWEASWAGAQVKRDQERVSKGITKFDSGHHFRDFLSEAKPVVQLAVLMVVACNVILGLPRRGCHWLFAMVEYILNVALRKVFPDHSFPQYFSSMLAAFPRDIRTATDHLPLERKSTIHAACPRCDATYHPILKDEEDQPLKYPKYRHRCNAQKYGSHCGELLVRHKVFGKHTIYVPIKPYVVFDFKDWVADLLSRDGYEQQMDDAWNRSALPPSGFMTDIFQGSVIREFKGADGRPFSASGGDNAGRYLFSMGCDFFNPLRNLTAGKKVSLGVIIMACLNLPIEIRYKPENMFLAGIIPGPKEPSLDAVNPYLAPIVDVLLLFWTGVLFSCTALHPLGRLILCALIIVICDLPAARKFGGFSGIHHEYFCSVCKCNKTQHGYNDFQYDNWEWRTTEHCRKHAGTFESAEDETEANRAFDSSGLRCSELLRLPYYEPSRFLVVDPMHNLFLGLIKEHFQNILGHRPREQDRDDDDSEGIRFPIHIPDDPSNPLPEGKKEKRSVRKLVSLLEREVNVGNADEQALFNVISHEWGSLKSVHLSAFIYVGRALHCIPDSIDAKGKDSNDPSARRLLKGDILDKLIRWRIQTPQTGEDRSASLDAQRGHLLSTEDMEELWKDLRRVVKPSWVTSVPTTLSSSGPKLKSDQWRTIGYLYLPITLIRIWSQFDPDHLVRNERQELLHLTMSLLSAIAAGTSRVTSDAHSRMFRQHMTEYRRELARLFPGYSCHPNHHMAFHITELLIMYGPVYGWWTFPFERVIGMLQRINTNYKQGEYEQTISRSWNRSSSFRALFSKKNCPKSIKLCTHLFETLTGRQIRNSLSVDPLLGREDVDMIDIEDSDVGDEGEDDRAVGRNLTDGVWAVFSTAFPQYSGSVEKAKMINRITHQGLSYTTRQIHEGNSGIFLKNSLVPACIEGFIETTTPSGQGLWVIVRRHRPFDITFDPYLTYPLLKARLWALDLEQNIEVFPVSQIDTHFAKCLISWEQRDAAVIISLSHMI